MMVRWQSDSIKRQTSRLTAGLASGTQRKKAVVNFAKRHKLIYFSSVSSGGQYIPVIRGSTASADQSDVHSCIGTHADYDMALVERTATVAFDGYKSTIHRWYVLQIDLHKASNLPFIFIGTKQQTKAYYARLLTSHRQLRYLALGSAATNYAKFHSQYVVLSSPAELPLIYRLLTDETIDTIAEHHYPFAVEIEGDSLSLITDAGIPSQQLLDKLLHYGLWLAKEIDSRLD